MRINYLINLMKLFQIKSFIYNLIYIFLKKENNIKNFLRNLLILLKNFGLT